MHAQALGPDIEMNRAIDWRMDDAIGGIPGQGRTAPACRPLFSV
jgi:hypothetical protein